MNQTAADRPTAVLYAA